MKKFTELEDVYYGNYYPITYEISEHVHMYIASMLYFEPYYVTELNF